MKVEVGTIHSVKGETHAATLYLETSYYNKHESERIMQQLQGKWNNNYGVREKETLKMAYVGMSRPKYLLCMAIRKNRMSDGDWNELKNNGWEIEKTYDNE